MFLRDFCIQRPVFAIVINLLLVIGGLYALFLIPVRYLPKFDVPVVVVSTTLPGGSADLIERSVTTPLEQAVSEVDGIDFMSSISAANLSTIQIMFKGGFDPNRAAAAISARINQAQQLLPTGVLPPVVQQVSMDSQPSIYLSFYDPDRSALEITDIVTRRVKPMLSLIPGVSSLQVMGERHYSVRIKLDRFALAAQRLTIDDIVAALQAQNVDLPGGEIVNDDRRVSVLARTAIQSPAEFADLVVDTGTYPVRLGEVADIEVEPQSSDTGVRINGTEAVAIGVLRQSDANPVDISRAVNAMLPDIQRALPTGVAVAVAYDNAIFIDASVHEVIQTIMITIGLVVVVVLVFLGSLRSSSIALVAIPLSLGGGLAFLMVMGYSLNVFTLLAFVLVIGLVVDDAIVEVENIQRHVDHGMAPLTAGFKGSREIGFAVVAMTITLAAVYAPIGLLPGMIGSLFREFAFTLAATVIFSGFVAMTLSPMMCSRLLRPQTGNRIARSINEVFTRLARGYRRALLFSLRRRWLVGLIAVLAVAAGFATMSRLSGELAPAEDQGFALVLFSGPQDASPNYMGARAAEIEHVLNDVPERQSLMSLIGIPTRNQGIVFMLLSPWEQRTRTAMEIQAAIEDRLNGIPGAQVAMIDPDPLGGGGQHPVQFVMKSTLEYLELDQAIAPFLAEAKKYPGLQSVSTDLNLDTPVYNLVVDRDHAADLGLQMRTVADTMGELLGEQEVNRFNWQGSLYPVLLGLQTRAGLNAGMLEQVYLRTPSGVMVSMAAVATIEHGVGAAALSHFNQLRSVTLSADVSAGHNISEVAKDLEAIAARTLPPTVQVDWNGEVRQLKTVNASMLLVFALSFAFIYLVLAAQFESFRDPFIILSVAPLSIAGAGFALALSGGSVNLYSGVGFITLVGLIAKHGILITEFTNQLRDEGKPLQEALVEAATIRLRPILMTTAAMVLGALPLALVDGPGSASHSDIGWVIIGGMLFGTTLSLFVIPTVYTVLSRKGRPRVVVVPSDDELAPQSPQPAPMPAE